MSLDWKSLSELIGLLAVVLTLFFVGFELRQNTRAAESSATQEVHARFRDFIDNEIMIFLSNPKAKPWGAYFIDG